MNKCTGTTAHARIYGTDTRSTLAEDTTFCPEAEEPMPIIAYPCPGISIRVFPPVCVFQREAEQVAIGDAV